MTLCLDHKYLELLDNLLIFGSFEPSASLGLFFGPNPAGPVRFGSVQIRLGNPSGKGGQLAQIS